MPVRRRQPLAREEPAELQVAATNGSIVTDALGRKYIDFVMGWCVGDDAAVCGGNLQFCWLLSGERLADRKSVV